MDSQTLLVLLLILVAIAVVLLAVLVLRRPEARIGDLLERALRDEQREGRSELREQLEGLSRAQEVRIDGFARSLADLSTRTDQRLDVLRDTLSEDARKGRLESAESQQRFADALGQRLNELTQRNEQRIGEMRATLEGRLKELQADNAQKLEQMRATVDEKLHATLETRLTESFGNVTRMLAQVHQGLGDMNKLAADVGGLQRVLTNVKNRGVFGEVQLASLLEQVLTADQYAAQRGHGARAVATKRVEFAVRFPGSSRTDAVVWLPIDAKFPREDYERLIEAQERGDAESVKQAGDAAGARRAQGQAHEIRKYIAVPPHHRIRDDVPADRGPVRRSAPPARVVRSAPARPPHHHCRADHSAGAADQPAGRIPHGGDREAIERRSGRSWANAEDRVRQVRRRDGLGEDQARAGHANSIDQAGVRTRAIERQPARG